MWPKALVLYLVVVGVYGVFLAGSWLEWLAFSVIFLVAAAVLVILKMIWFWRPEPWPKGALTLPFWQAHRGYRPDSSVAENTMEAFRLAKRAGAEMIECDVHLCRDGEVVVFHDFDLSRMAGRPELVRDLTSGEMARLAHAPRLVDVLTDPDCPRLVNIEMKSAEIRSSGEFERAVVRAIRDAKAEDRVLISSFNPFLLHRLARVAPEIPRALLATERSYRVNRIYLRKLWLAEYAGAHLLHLDLPMITPERMRKWKKRNVPVVAWTVNDPADAERMLSLGVKSVISDHLFAGQGPQTAQ
jgi:glycerophosphoryl diester phosphodiesterase